MKQEETNDGYIVIFSWKEPRQGTDDDLSDLSQQNPQCNQREWDFMTRRHLDYYRCYARS